MVAFGPGISCRDAELYYYDYLCGLEADLPQAVVDHIRHCADCETEIRQLEAAIGESEAQDRHAGDDADVAGTLGLHFAHIGEEITCAKAKSFLPMLLVPSLHIRIPTPVTVHVDHCRQCIEDLESLRRLELRPEQLARLGRLYAATVGNEPHLLCRRARAKTWAFACASFDGIEPELLDHMCVCPRCRRRVYRRREKILISRQPGDTITGIGLCSGISTADLFDWVVPYGRGGDGTEPAPAGDGAMPSHLRACPECIERIQALHRTVYGIAERVDSGVSTVYTTGTKVVTSSERVESPYYGYPIHVEVGHRDRERAAIRFEPVARIRVLGRRIASPEFKPVRRVALMATAVIPLAIILFVSTRPASGLSVRQLAADALRNVEALHVVRYGMYGTRPEEETWIGQDAGLVVVKNANGQFVYDLRKGEMTVRWQAEGTVESARLAPDDRVIARGVIEHALGFSRYGAPLNKDLERTAVESAQGTEDVYELTWTEVSSGDPAPQYRVIVLMDPATRLPRTAELWRNLSDADGWRLTNRWEYERSTQEQVNLAIQNGLAAGWDQSGDHRGL